MDYSQDCARELLASAIRNRAADKANNAKTARLHAVAITETARLADRSATMRRDHSDAARERQKARSA
jgi:hypothetical protein